MFVATINTPGYLPDDAGELPEFDTAREAWEYLMGERARHLDEMESSGLAFHDATWLKLRAASLDGTSIGTVYGDTPGYDGNHDLGLAYSVDTIF